MIALRYTKEHESTWNRFVAESKNATFLFDRRFMDYHADRFVDCSLVFEDKGRIVACLPACIDEGQKRVVSHGGLTYGGLLTAFSTTTVQVMDALSLAVKYYRDECGAETFVYKPIPHIYSKYPSDEDLYALFRLGARLVGRGVSSAILVEERLPFSASRIGGVKKALRNGLKVEESRDVSSFWSLLNDVLGERHGVKPVHSVAELELLMSCFPINIRLFVVRNAAGELLAGTLVFDTWETLHTQYMAASVEGKRLGALDFLLDYLITDMFTSHRYFDFGVSTERQGLLLNKGLMFQKEGFGGRAVCYDTYLVDLTR